MIVNKVRAYVLSGALILGASACHNASKNEKLLQKASTEVCNAPMASLLVKRFKSAKDSISFLKDSTKASACMDKFNSTQDVIKNKAMAIADKKRNLTYKLADVEQSHAYDLADVKEAKAYNRAKKLCTLTQDYNTFFAQKGKAYNISLSEYSEALKRYRNKISRAESAWNAETEKASNVRLEKGKKEYDMWLNKIKKSEKCHCTPEYLEKTQSP